MQTQTIEIKKDLWGDLKSDNRIVDPLILLEEQAALLSQKTDNIVYSKVIIKEIKAHEAKSLWNKPIPFLKYRFELLVTSSDYKSSLFWILKPKNEVHYPLTIFPDAIDDYFTIETPLEFELKVTEILRSKATKERILGCVEMSKVQNVILV